MAGNSKGCGIVLVVDDDACVRALVCTVLEGAGFAVAEAGTGEEAIAAALADRPHAVVLDVKLPGISGYEVCRRLRDDFGDSLPILFVSGERVESYDRVAGLLLGADDSLTKPFAPDELLARLHGLLRRASPPPAASDLTGRELEVLGLLAAGLGQPEIADQLVISPKTVATHIERILSKLGVHTRAQAVARAYRDGLLEPTGRGEGPRPAAGPLNRP
jgi:DNA-binding NarL/FixJ family response regulator